MHYLGNSTGSLKQTVSTKGKPLNSTPGKKGKK